jgi:hypothetical protein
MKLVYAEGTYGGGVCTKVSQTFRRGRRSSSTINIVSCDSRPGTGLRRQTRNPMSSAIAYVASLVAHLLGTANEQLQLFDFVSVVALIV